MHPVNGTPDVGAVDALMGRLHIEWSHSWVKKVWSPCLHGSDGGDDSDRVSCQIINCTMQGGDATLNAD